MCRLDAERSAAGLSAGRGFRGSNAKAEQSRRLHQSRKPQPETVGVFYCLYPMAWPLKIRQQLIQCWVHPSGVIEVTKVDSFRVLVEVAVRQLLQGIWLVTDYRPSLGDGEARFG